MKVIITGHSGMLGSALLAEAARRGWEVLPAPPDLPLWTDPLSGATEPDVAEPAFAEWVMDERADAVLHAAAVVGSHRSAQLGARAVSRSNVWGAVNVARAARAAGSALLFYASDSELDPDGYDRNFPISLLRGAHVSGLCPRTMYGVTKLAARLLVQEVYARAGIPAPQLLLAYPSFGYGGPLDVLTCTSKLLRAAAAVPGYGRQSVQLDPDALKDPTHHGDMARLALGLLSAGASGPYPLAAGDPVSFADVLRLAEGASGREVSVDWRPDLDYKGDLVYDREEVSGAWRAAGESPTPRAELFAAEVAAYERAPGGVRPHVADDFSALEDASGGRGKG